MSIVGFLLARISEDEVVAHAAATDDEWGIESIGSEPRIEERVTGVWLWLGYTQTPGYVDPPQGYHIARFNPTRILAECKAKRAIIAVCNESGDYERTMDSTERRILEALAAVHNDHPNYRQEWTA